MHSPGESEATDNRIDVQAALAKLGEKDRLLLTLFYLNDYSVREIAALLDAKEGAVRVRLSRARERFREIYDVNASKAKDSNCKKNSSTKQNDAVTVYPYPNGLAQMNTIR